jgi:hypothetical protein
MATQPIDISSGLVPIASQQSSAGDIDISAGLVPVSRPSIDPNNPTAVANRALEQASPGRGMQVSGAEQNPRRLARNMPMQSNSAPVAGALSAGLDTADAMRKSAEEDAKPNAYNLLIKPMLGAAPAVAGMAKLPAAAGEHIANSINAFHGEDPITGYQEAFEGAGDAAQAVGAAKLASPAIADVTNAARGGAYDAMRGGAVRLMNRVVRPTDASFQFGRDPGAAALDEGAWGWTRKGVLDDVSDAIEKRTQQLNSAVNSPAANAKAIDLRPVIKNVFDPRIDFLTKHGEVEQAQALTGMRDNYLDPKIWPNISRMSPAEATALKRDIGDLTRWSGDPLEASKMDARRALYGKTKDQVNAAVPEAAPLNERISSLLTAQKALKSAVNRDQVASPMNLVDAATTVAGGPGAAIARKVVTAPGTASVAANLLNRTAKMIQPLSRAELADRLTQAGGILNPDAARAAAAQRATELALPPGQYEAPPAPVRGMLPETTTPGMQSIPTEIEGTPYIPRQPRALPPPQPEPIQAPPTPVRGYLSELGTIGRQSVPTEIEGTPAIPRFEQRALPPPSQIQLPPSSLTHPDIGAPHEVVAHNAETGLPVVRFKSNAQDPAIAAARGDNLALPTAEAPPPQTIQPLSAESQAQAAPSDAELAQEAIIGPPEKIAERYGPGVELVPISELEKIREFDREANPATGFRDPDYLDKLTKHMRENGLESPLSVVYNPETHHAILGSGNHRLAAAKRLGLTELPVKVTTEGVGMMRAGAEVPGHTGEVKDNFTPSEIGLKSGAVTPEKGAGAVKSCPSSPPTSKAFEHAFFISMCRRLKAGSNRDKRLDAGLKASSTSAFQSRDTDTPALLAAVDSAARALASRDVGAARLPPPSPVENK